MKIHIVHSFPCTPERYWKCFFDPELTERMEAMSKMERELLSEKFEGEVAVRRQRITSHISLPPNVTRFLGGDKLAYEQITRVDLANSQIDWKIISPVLTDKVKAAGTLRVVATPMGCDRVLDGEVSVKIAMLGKRIEKMIVDLLTKIYDKSAEVHLGWISERG